MWGKVRTSVEFLLCPCWGDFLFTSFFSDSIVTKTEISSGAQDSSKYDIKTLLERKCLNAPVSVITLSVGQKVRENLPNGATKSKRKT